MLNHCVFIKFLPEVSQMQRELLYQAIYDLRHQLPGWLNYLSGPNVTPEAGMDKGFEGVLVFDFADNESQKRRNATPD